MDILSDVNIVGSIEVTGGAIIDNSITINKSLAIISPAAGVTNFYTVQNMYNSFILDLSYPPITIFRSMNGASVMTLANGGRVDVDGKLIAKSLSYFCQSVYNCSTVYFCKGFDVSGEVNIDYLENYHSGKIKNSFFNWNHFFGETTTIDVPADCTRFFIGDVYVIHDDANFDFRTVECLADYFVYPTISVYKENKKVDMDIEIGTLGFPSGNEGKYANNSFTEVIIGNIKACSSEQQFKVAISPTFQFDY